MTQTSFDFNISRQHNLNLDEYPLVEVSRSFQAPVEQLCKEIIPNKKIINTDQFCDKDGKPISASEVGMPGNWPNELYVTIEFNALGTDQTNIVIRHEGIPKEMHDDCVSGWNSSIDKLQKLVERS